MASPQLENGFAMIASELVAAIFIADFPKYEKVVIADILLSQYGPLKLKTTPVDHIRLAGMIGVDPRMIRRAVANLIKRGVIREHANGNYTFIKDWESWTNPKDSGRHSDPLCTLIGVGEKRFIAYSTERFTPLEPSKRKRKVGTNESPKSDYEGTIQSPNNRNAGTAWSPMNSDGKSASPGESKDLEITSSSEARSLDSSSSEYRRVDNNNGVLSTEPTHRGCGGVREDQLDELRDQVAKLTEDDNLADVFRDQIGDWMTSGMIPEDVRQAILVARGKGVDPRSYVAFVTSTAKRLRNERLTSDRQAKANPETPFALAASPVAPRLSQSQRAAAERERIKETFRANKLRKEGLDVNGA